MHPNLLAVSSIKFVMVVGGTLPCPPAVASSSSWLLGDEFGILQNCGTLSHIKIRGRHYQGYLDDVKWWQVVTL